MDKVCVNINEIALTKALILWNTGVDNEDGGTCNITAELPWIPEWEKFMTWEEANEKFIDESIGKRDESIFPIELISDYLVCLVDNANNRVGMRVDALQHLTEWAKNRAKVIIWAYEKAIAELNRRIEASKIVYGMIEKSVGVDSRGFVKYEKVALIKGKSKNGVINRLWMIAYGLVNPNDCDEGSFKSGLYYGNSVYIGDGYHCHLGNKVTNS